MGRYRSNRRSTSTKMSTTRSHERSRTKKRNPYRNERSDNESSNDTSPSNSSRHRQLTKSKKNTKNECSCFYAVFGTRQLVSKKNRETLIRVTIRELLIYIIYLSLVCTLTYSTTSTSTYHLTNVMRDLFIDQPLVKEDCFTSDTSFKTSKTLDDFWDFTKGPLLSGLYWEFLYEPDAAFNDPDCSGSPELRSAKSSRMFQKKSQVNKRDAGENVKAKIKGAKTKSMAKSTIDFTTMGLVFENRLIGAPRLRQVRVKADSCKIAPNFHRVIRRCYPPYSLSHEDTSWGSKFTLDTAWKYFSEEKLGGTTHWGRVSRYGGGGAYINLARDQYPRYQILRAKVKARTPRDTVKSQESNAHNNSSRKSNPRKKNILNFNYDYDPAKATLEAVERLKSDRWITRATRAIFLDFTVYNANVDALCIVKLLWEFPATGGVATSWSMQTLKLKKLVAINYTDERNSENWTWSTVLTWIQRNFILECQILFCIFIAYYLIQEFCELGILGFKTYIFNMWSWVDIGILSFSIACIGLSFYRDSVLEERMAGLNWETEEYVNFDRLSQWQSLYENGVAILMFVLWMKLFKYISFNMTMTHMSKTLAMCAGDIGYFSVMFSIVFASFAQLGYILFGAQVEAFSSFIKSAFTLLLLILGQFDFLQLMEVNPILAPIYFLSYVFFVFFVLVNMFLALVTDAFGEVKLELRSRQSEFRMTDYLSHCFGNCWRWCRRKDNGESDANYDEKLAAADGQITYQELTNHLRASFSHAEIQVFLARYNLNHNRALDEEEIHHVLNKLENDILVTSQVQGWQDLGRDRNRNRGQDQGQVDAQGDEETEPGARNGDGGGSGDAKSTHGLGPIVDPGFCEGEIDAMDKRVSSMEATFTTMIQKIDKMIVRLKKLS